MPLTEKRKSTSKLCILMAGSGVRMGRYQGFNKGLLPLEQKSILSHIIEQFPNDTEIVIAIGYLGNIVRQFISFTYPQRKIVFVEVEPHQGPGSGPGLSLLKCSPFLQESFYFVCCDTLWEEDKSMFLAEDIDWIGVSEVSSVEASQYCAVEIKDNAVVGLKDKQPSNSNENVFIGLAHIKNFAHFWKGLRTDHCIGQEKQLSSGFEALIKEGSLQPFLLKWTDIGNEKKYLTAVQMKNKYDFGKTDELAYHENGRFIKYYKDKNIIKSRVSRAELSRVGFPKIDNCTENFLSYRFVEGEVLYKHLAPKNFSNFMIWLDQNFWMQKQVSTERIHQACKKFYYEKTMSRVDDFLEKNSEIDKIDFINGTPVEGVKSLLNAVEWDQLFAGSPFFIHGDLQPDNVIFNPQDKSFTLIDWRQDFGGELEFGDIHYDFAKLIAGLTINYLEIKNGNFSIQIEGQVANIRVPSVKDLNTYSQSLSKFIEEKKLSVKKSKILACLVFLNMAALHHPPFDQVLFLFGKYLLQKLVYAPNTKDTNFAEALFSSKVLI